MFLGVGLDFRKKSNGDNDCENSILAKNVYKSEHIFNWSWDDGSQIATGFNELIYDSISSNVEI